MLKCSLQCRLQDLVLLPKHPKYFSDVFDYFFRPIRLFMFFYYLKTTKCVNISVSFPIKIQNLQQANFANVVCDN